MHRSGQRADAAQPLTGNGSVAAALDLAVIWYCVDRRGFRLPRGQQAETATILPIITAFQQCHRGVDGGPDGCEGVTGKPGGMVVVADAGMLPSSNLRELDEAGLRFIVGSRVTKAPADLDSHFGWHGDAFVARGVGL